MNTFSKVTKQEVQVLLKLRHPDLAPLRQLFENALTEIKRSLVRMDDTEMIRRLQGKAIVCEDFLEVLDQAPQILERMK